MRIPHTVSRLFAFAPFVWLILAPAALSVLRRAPLHRPVLLPGLPEILSSLTYTSHPGLLGICLSGAGPTILALATGNFEVIAAEIQRIFKEHGVEVDWEVLEVDERGSWVEDVTAAAAAA
jgi:homoserine kinase